MFQKSSVNFATYQAAVMGIPLISWRTSGAKNEELKDLEEALLYVKEKGVSGVITGALLSDYQRLNINLIALKAGLKVYSPLWRKDQSRYMFDLIRHGFTFVITSASAYGFPFHLVGKEVVSEEQVEEIVEAALTYGFNPAFEGGEAETFVTFAPLFSRKLRLEGRTVKEGEFRWRYDISRIL
ncbi:ATP-binding protein [Sulfodiicoccus acidiphilus]|uniref:ATP-binding protein n=2 Tax=Sulfodiicoccus acidiphilus TaxID=1670455 RepID=A0A348B0M5_9CREN|nr:ATP-binding protein [Sulfodiicoccus acidiphilus]GGT86299.1 ATP-binding protein [Sulfodiicoccus acidiphilus]